MIWPWVRECNDLQTKIARLEQTIATLQEQYDAHPDSRKVMHVAAGALRDSGAHRDQGPTADSVIYPAIGQVHHLGSIISPDLSTMPVTAKHGTVTFQLPEHNREELISAFKANLSTLDDPERNEDIMAALRSHGWNLIRPPRVRLFFADDTLYIGTEVPASFENLLKQSPPNWPEYRRQQTAFARTIAKLIIPGMEADIDALIANSRGVNAPSFFETARGETGDVANLSANNVMVINHGDRRYLPHYQTGSGFLTAVEQNKVYADVYENQQASPEATYLNLLQKGSERVRITDPQAVLEVNTSVSQGYFRAMLQTKIAKILEGQLNDQDKILRLTELYDQEIHYYLDIDADPDFRLPWTNGEEFAAETMRVSGLPHENIEFAGHEQHWLKALSKKVISLQKDQVELSTLLPKHIDDMTDLLRADLHTQLTHDILDENKIKVDKYFKALHQQAIRSVTRPASYMQLLTKYHEGGNPEIGSFSHMSGYELPMRVMGVMEMLIHGSDEFLLDTLPSFINTDISGLKNIIEGDFPESEKKAAREKLHLLRNGFTSDYMRFIQQAEIFSLISEADQDRIYQEIFNGFTSIEAITKSISSVLGMCPSHIDQLSVFSEEIIKQGARKKIADQSSPVNDLVNSILSDTDGFSKSEISIIVLEFEKELNKAEFFQRKAFAALPGKHSKALQTFLERLEYAKAYQNKAYLAATLLDFNDYLHKHKSVRVLAGFNTAVQNVSQTNIKAQATELYGFSRDFIDQYQKIPYAAMPEIEALALEHYSKPNEFLSRVKRKFPEVRLDSNPLAAKAIMQYILRQKKSAENLEMKFNIKQILAEKIVADPELGAKIQDLGNAYNFAPGLQNKLRELLDLDAEESLFSNVESINIARQIMSNYQQLSTNTPKQISVLAQKSQQYLNSLFYPTETEITGRFNIDDTDEQSFHVEVPVSTQEIKQIATAFADAMNKEELFKRHNPIGNFFNISGAHTKALKQLIKDMAAIQKTGDLFHLVETLEKFTQYMDKTDSKRVKAAFDEALSSSMVSIDEIRQIAHNAQPEV